MGRVYLTNVSFKPAEKKHKHNPKPHPKKGKKLYALCIENEDHTFSAFVRRTINGVNEKFTIPFSEDSHNITGKNKIFSINPDDHNHIVCIIRTKQHAKQFPGIPELYTPFRKDYVYSGYIITKDNKKYFDIDECLDSVNIFEHLLNNK